MEIITINIALTNASTAEESLYRDNLCNVLRLTASSNLIYPQLNDWRILFLEMETIYRWFKENLVTSCMKDLRRASSTGIAVCALKA